LKKLRDAEKEHEKLSELTEAYASYIKNRSAIISKNLSCLVRGTGNTDAILKELEAGGLIFDYLLYRVAAVSIEGWENPEKEAEDSTDNPLYSFAVANICSEIMQNEQGGLAFQNGECQVILLLGTKKAVGFPEKAASVCRKCQETIHDIMHLTVSVGIGGTVRSIRNLGSSFQDAESCTRYRYVLGRGYFIDAESEADQLDREPDIKELLSLLVFSIKTLSYEKIAASFSEIENRILERKVSENRCRLYLQQVYHAIQDALKLASDTGHDLNAEEGHNIQETIAKSGNLKEALSSLRSYAYECVQLLRSLAATNGELESMLAIDFLHEHYSDPGLSLNELCSYLGISPSHFSSLFKENTGMTFMEKLTAIRIEKAKEMLSATNLRNYEISERVGYLDPHYFSIVFKKATGQSPSDYAHEKKA
jgi:two-component system response regulator YesN